jgi:hypothetical protein
MYTMSTFVVKKMYAKFWLEYLKGRGHVETDRRMGLRQMDSEPVNSVTCARD